MSIFFSSDWHCFHKSVINFCNRPFKDIEEMHESLVDNYQSVVKPKDEVWFLGDMAFYSVDDAVEIYRKLNGSKHLVFGNHDKKYRNRYINSGVFQSYQDYKELKYEKNKMILCHYPFFSWNRSKYGSWSIHGHCHSTIDDQNEILLAQGYNRYDVGVDGNNYFPVSYEQLKERFNGKL